MHQNEKYILVNQLYANELECLKSILHTRSDL